MDLATASVAIKKATNVFKALKDVDAALDAALVLENYTKELQAAGVKAKADLEAANEQLNAAKVATNLVHEGNAGLVAEAQAEAEIIKSKGKADAAGIVAAANAKAEEIRADIAANNRTLSTIRRDIADAEASLAEKKQALEDLKKLIETTKAQFKAIGG